MKIAGQVVGPIGDKRFKLPGLTISELCPDCRQNIYFDESHGYISYPKFGQPCLLVFYCQDCDLELLKKIKIDVIITEV